MAYKKRDVLAPERVDEIERKIMSREAEKEKRADGYIRVDRYFMVYSQLVDKILFAGQSVKQADLLEIMRMSKAVVHEGEKLEE